ncbi:hypothetical protein CL656_02735 [bacterium]|nr:hypothetical protein [bacterium]|tara:strand:+ start:872 stop:1870 length:999 start_codon:yes stop_codon:yes gene_type:complete
MFYQIFLGTILYAVILSSIFLFVCSKLNKNYKISISDSFLIFSIMGFIFYGIFDYLKPSNSYYVFFGLIVYLSLTLISFKWLNLRFKSKDKFSLICNLISVLIFFSLLINSFFHVSVFERFFPENSVDLKSDVEIEDKKNDLSLEKDVLLDSIPSYQDESIEVESFEKETSEVSSKKSLKTDEYYSGYYFKVDIPQGFKVDLNRSSNNYVTLVTDKAETDVEFFVYAPMWSRYHEYLDQRIDEVLVSKEEKKLPKDSTDLSGTHRLYTYYTYQNKNTGVLRSIVDQRSQVGLENRDSELRVVFGVTYPDYKIYEEYKELYLEFKNSVVQFAD